MPDILFQTDFGVWGGASRSGMCKIVNPALRPYTLSHTVPSCDGAEASKRLAIAVPCWPPGTVFVSVADPGVGTPRRASAALTDNGYYIVTPDNGTLTHIRRWFGIHEIREIDETVNRYPLTPKVSIFHGRDLFAYCAARLASGIITFEQVGPAYPTEEIVMLDIAESAAAAYQLPREIAAALEKKPRFIVVLNDFKHDGRMAMIKGLCKKISSGTEVYDIPLSDKDILRAGEIAKETAYSWPEGTEFVTVTDCNL
jgi:S-adenosylmethionine hydrolase